ncbi:hypothetical protein GCM10010151_12630 [Actinoallomurus spadix]|uniref:Uncharacterized protein n=1 Tax=Actinoallomurus spadix TaxID=79912 RepID=A0ABN0W3V2_9ACTN
MCAGRSPVVLHLSASHGPSRTVPLSEIGDVRRRPATAGFGGTFPPGGKEFGAAPPAQYGVPVISEATWFEKRLGHRAGEDAT